MNGSSSFVPLVYDVPRQLLGRVAASRISSIFRLEALHVYTVLYVTWQSVPFFDNLTLKKFFLKSSLAAGILTFTSGSAAGLVTTPLHRPCSLFRAKHRGPPPISPS